jgi:hypothetical protein
MLGRDTKIHDRRDRSCVGGHFKIASIMPDPMIGRGARCKERRCIVALA